MIPEIADREIASGVWLRRQGTDEEHAEVIIPSQEVPKMTRWRRARMAALLAMVHLIWISGPSDTLVERDDLWPFPEWDDVEHILAAAKAAEGESK